MKAVIFICAVVLAATLAGCAVGPDYSSSSGAAGTADAKSVHHQRPRRHQLPGLENCRAIRPSVPRCLVAPLCRPGTEPAGNPGRYQQSNPGCRRRPVRAGPPTGRGSAREFFPATLRRRHTQTATSCASVPASTRPRSAKPPVNRPLTTRSPRRSISVGNWTFGAASGASRKPPGRVSSPRADDLESAAARGHRRSG